MLPLPPFLPDKKVFFTAAKSKQSRESDRYGVMMARKQGGGNHAVRMKEVEGSEAERRARGER